VPLAIIGVNHVRKIVRLSVAIGGFLIVTSLILTGTVILIFLGITTLSVFENQTGIFMITLILLAIGIADFIAGFILLRRTTAK
jgi:hypothetical protein